ncbi:MAG: MFS transporter [Lachnospiraceae bacterium]|nr:MFS transporter [Lachnospiraceae bacterium]
MNNKWVRAAIPALLGIYLFYGCIMGIGLGIGYLTPVKTLMLWFSEQKGLATGISIMGFGLAKAIATPIMEMLQKRYGIAAMFYILGAIYFCMMFLGHILLRKPEGWKEETDRAKSDFRLSELLKNKVFIGIWLMFFINIHCAPFVEVRYAEHFQDSRYRTFGMGGGRDNGK